MQGKLHGTGLSLAIAQFFGSTLDSGSAAFLPLLGSMQHVPKKPFPARSCRPHSYFSQTFVVQP